VSNSFFALDAYNPRADTDPERGARMKSRERRNSFWTESLQALLEVDRRARCVIAQCPT
jgi:hypothetical protein